MKNRIFNLLTNARLGVLLLIMTFLAFGANVPEISASPNADGDLDETFGTGGKAVFNFNGTPDQSGVDNDYGLDAVIQPDGKNVLVGYSFVTQTDSAFSLMRLNADGSPDTTFGTNGKIINNVTVGATDGAYSVALQTNGKIVGSGFRTSSTGVPVTDFMLARYDNSGNAGATFGTNGIIYTNFNGSSRDTALNMAWQNGKLTLVGYTNSANRADSPTKRLISATAATSVSRRAITTATTGTISRCCCR